MPNKWTLQGEACDYLYKILHRSSKKRGKPSISYIHCWNKKASGFKTEHISP